MPRSADVDHGDVLADFGEALDEAKRKATEGRVYDAENERLQIEWLRAYTEAVAMPGHSADHVAHVRDRSMKEFNTRGTA